MPNAERTKYICITFYQRLGHKIKVISIFTRQQYYIFNGK